MFQYLGIVLVCKFCGPHGSGFLVVAWLGHEKMFYGSLVLVEHVKVIVCRRTVHLTKKKKSIGSYL